MPQLLLQRAHFDSIICKELQTDIVRKQRLEQNVRMIEAREREEQGRRMIAQAKSPTPLRVASGSQNRTTQNEGEQSEVAEDPWEKAKQNAPPEEPTSWQPQVGKRRS
ncbi:transport protein [Ceratobasidium theobromae]|uniref:Transport protein n=1 Tax=Ceratobasidium theobromae TaxID=1582974 RepID=A0A5N5QPG7_9AGAM|nr:transport protein [Ceratobasidium theobromae]